MESNPFWTYSIELYAQDGVAALCLRLQDERGFDVNLLLFAGWAAHCRGVTLDASEWRDLIAATQSWRETVLAPLRSVRRRLKTAHLGAFPGNPEQMRAAILKVELDCEKTEQDFLASAMGAFVAAHRDDGTVKGALLNLHRLTNAMDVSLSTEVEAELTALADFFAEFQQKTGA